MNANLLLYKVSKRSAKEPGNWILDRISLFIPQGSFVAFIGPSGSGKSSLLRIIAGLDLPSLGSIWLDGRNKTDLPPQYRRIGFVGQNFALFPHMKVKDNIHLGLRIRHIPPSYAEQKVQELLGPLRIGDIQDKYPHQLSGGQKQRVALARSLVVQPDILLLDEPFKALDQELRRALSRWLYDYTLDKGMTTLMVTHDQQEALSMAKDIFVLDRGRLIQQGTPKMVYTQPINSFVARFLGISEEKPIFASRTIFSHKSEDLSRKGPEFCPPSCKGQMNRDNGWDLAWARIQLHTIVYKKRKIDLCFCLSSSQTFLSLSVSYYMFAKLQLCARHRKESEHPHTRYRSYDALSSLPCRSPSSTLFLD